MWTYDCFQGFYTNWRVSRENIIYSILVGNQNVHSCANNYWSTLYTSSCIENMEIKITSSISSLCEIKIYSCAIIISLRCILHLVCRIWDLLRCEVGNYYCEINWCLWKRYCCRHMIKHKSMKLSQSLWMKIFI